MQKFLDRNRYHIAFLILVLVGAVVCLGIGISLYATCLPPHVVNQGAGEDNAQKSEGGNYTPNSNQQQTAAPTSPINPIQAGADERQTASNGQQDASDSQRALPEIALCNIKTSDLALVFFTYCLVIVGWLTIAASNSNMRATERARIYIGVNPLFLMPIPTGTKVGLALTNDGKTGGIIKQIAVGFSQEEPSGNRAGYETAKKKTKCDAYGPGYRTSPAQVFDHFESPYGGVHFCFGYVLYEDIWGDMHESRFCNKVDPAKRIMEAAGTPVWNLDN